MSSTHSSRYHHYHSPHILHCFAFLMLLTAFQNSYTILSAAHYTVLSLPCFTISCIPLILLCSLSYFRMFRVASEHLECTRYHHFLECWRCFGMLRLVLILLHDACFTLALLDVACVDFDASVPCVAGGLFLCCLSLRPLPPPSWGGACSFRHCSILLL